MNGREKAFNKTALPCALKSTKRFKRAMHFRQPNIELHHDWTVFIWASGKLVQVEFEGRTKI